MKKARTYKDIVKDAKKVARLLRLTNEQRMKLAGLAQEVCEVVHGGRARPSRHTLRKFGEDIQINAQTLSEWVRMKELIHDKLTAPNKQDFYGMSGDSIKRFTTQVKKTTPKPVLNRKFAAYVKRGPQSDKFHKYVKVLDTLIYNLTDYYKVENVDEALLKECMKKASKVNALAKKAIDIKNGDFKQRKKAKPIREINADNVWEEIGLE